MAGAIFTLKKPPKYMKYIKTYAAITVVAGAAAITTLYVKWDQAVPLVAMAVNYVRSWSAPPGTLSVESSVALPSTVVNPAPSPPATSLANPPPPAITADDWPSYNKTLTSERFSPLSQISVWNVRRLKILCAYDTQQHTSFETGPLMVNGALIATTEHDIFSLNPSNCTENWRTHEDYQPATIQGVNRGAAYLDGRLFRGTEDGRVLAYDFKTGKRLWETSVADPKRGETTPAAPIAWNGMVFIGNAGGDVKGVKGRMYALDASAIPPAARKAPRRSITRAGKIYPAARSPAALPGPHTRSIHRPASSTSPAATRPPISPPPRARAETFIPARL